MVTALKTSINILLVFLFAACTSVPDERMTPYVDFPETRELTARTLSLDSALFRYPYRVLFRQARRCSRRDAFSRKSSMEWELFVDT